jgi:hypothetical protein
MNRSLIALGCAAASAAAWAQPETSKKATAENRASAVTFAELDGVVVEARVVLQEVIRRQGKQFPIRAVGDTKLTIGPGTSLYVTLTSTSHHPRGVSKGQPISFVSRLERPGEVAKSNMGGGHGVWVFSDGTLTNLRTYGGGGAFKRDIVFTRTAGGLACKITEGFAREGGTGSIAFNSPIDGVLVTVVSARQVSSSCQVTKRN